MADDESEYEYEVNKILDKKIDKGQVFYKINWKGYTPEFDTWEPVENLNHSNLAIEIYEKSIAINNKATRKRRRSCGARLSSSLTSTPKKGNRSKRKRVRFSSSCEYVLLNDDDSDRSQSDTSMNLSSVTYDLKLPMTGDETVTKGVEPQIKKEEPQTKSRVGWPKGRPRKCSLLPSTSTQLARIDSVIDDVIKREMYVTIIQAEVENVKASLRKIQEENDEDRTLKTFINDDRSCSPELYPTSSFLASIESADVSKFGPGPISPSMPVLEKCVLSPKPVSETVIYHSNANHNLVLKTYCKKADEPLEIRVCNDNCFRRPTSSQDLRVAPIQTPNKAILLAPSNELRNLPDDSPFARTLAKLKDNVTKLEQMMTNLKLGQVSKGSTLKRLVDNYKPSPLVMAMKCLADGGDPESHVNGFASPVKTLHNGLCQISLDGPECSKNDASGSSCEEKFANFRSDLKHFKRMWNKRHELLTHPKIFPISYLLSDQEKMMMDQNIKDIIAKNDIQELDELLHSYHSCHLHLNLIHNDKSLLTVCCSMSCSKKIHHSVCSVMECLLIKGADLNQIGVQGSTALLLATSKGFTCQTELLIRFGANLGTLNEHGENVLFPVRETNFIAL